MDAADFDPDAVDEDGLPLVYNEEKIAKFWSGRPGELLGRWTKFTAIAGGWVGDDMVVVLSHCPQQRGDNFGIRLGHKETSSCLYTSLLSCQVRRALCKRSC
jgi:hypothetical protein